MSSLRLERYGSAEASQVFLSFHTDWRDRVRAEIDAFKEEYSPTSAGRIGTNISDVPLHVWQSNLPVLDLCISETVRLVATGVFVRRNVGLDMEVDGRVIRAGEFVLMMMEDANLNPNIYDDPLLFQPDRDLTKAARTPLSMLSWGEGEKLFISLKHR